MSKKHCMAAMFSANLLLTGANIVSGQDFPSKPIRIVAPPVGTGSDFASRLVAQGMSSSFGQQVLVENRPTILAIESVSKAQPDGYTLLIVSGALWIGPLLQTLSYDAGRDFAPVSMLVRSPNVIVVHPSLPVKSVKELVNLARTRPGELNYPSGAAGGSSHLAGELFKATSGTNIVRVTYASSGAPLNALLGGEVQMSFEGISTAASHVKSGRLRALAVTSAEPSALAPGLPTVASEGLPGYEFVTLQGLFAPAQTPAALVSRLSQDIARFLQRPETRERFFKAGVESVGSTPDELAAAIKSETVRLGRVIKSANIKAN